MTKLLTSFRFRTIPDKVMYNLPNIRKIGNLFYLQKVYALARGLFICKSIPYLSGIMLQVYYLINRNWTLLINVVSSKNLIFFFYIKFDGNNILGYNWEKDLSMSLRELNWHNVKIDFRSIAINNRIVI